MEWIICQKDCRTCPFAEHLQCPPGDRPQCAWCAWAPVCPCTNPDRSPKRAARLLARMERAEALVYLPPEMIQPPLYPLRLSMDREKLKELAQSMQSDLGMVEPIVVRPVKGGGVQLVVGSRRLAAAKMARFKAIACRIKELSDREALLLSLVENLQREDLTWAEEARALAELQRITHWSAREIARRIGKSHRWVCDRLQAWETLEKAGIEPAKHKVSPGVTLEQPTLPPKAEGRPVPPLRAVTAVAKVPEPEARRRLLQEVVEKGLTKEETDARVAEVLEAEQPGTVLPERAAPTGAETASPAALEQLVKEGLVTRGIGAITFTRAEVLYLCEVVITLNVADFMRRHGRRCALLATDPITGKRLPEQAMEIIQDEPLNRLKEILLEEAGRVLKRFRPNHPCPFFNHVTQTRVAEEERDE